jgi:RNA polymerase sigma-70 factor (ECF subfamily)
MEDKVKDIWENFDRQLRGLICNKMNNQDECLDVLQDVYLKIIVNIERISGIDNLPSYLNKLASNAVIDHYRKRTKTAEFKGVIIDKDILIVDEVNQNDEQLKNCCLQCLQPGIDILPEKYKEAFILSEVQGMPQKEVAAKLGISLSGAKSRVQRAREKLKEEVMKCCYNEP